jgi:hypothetical protein
VKVLVCRQQDQVVFAAQLYEQGVDGSNLYPPPAAGVSDFCGLNVIFFVWLKEGQR